MSTTRTPDSAALEPRSIVHVDGGFYLASRIVSRALFGSVYGCA